MFYVLKVQPHVPVSYREEHALFLKIFLHINSEVPCTVRRQPYISQNA